MQSRLVCVSPRPYQEELPIWVAIGRTPESVNREAKSGLPMGLAIIGGMPGCFGPIVDLYRETWERSGHIADKMKMGINSHAYVAETLQQAADEFFPSYAEAMTRIGRDRGWPPTSRQQYEEMRGPSGALLVGSSQQVIDKILFEHSIFKHDRFLAQMDVGILPRDKLMKSIELFGTLVAPAVRKALLPAAREA